MGPETGLFGFDLDDPDINMKINQREIPRRDDKYRNQKFQFRVTYNPYSQTLLFLLDVISHQ